jgi:hypothetical protein
MGGTLSTGLLLQGQPMLHGKTLSQKKKEKRPGAGG